MKTEQCRIYAVNRQIFCFSKIAKKPIQILFCLTILLFSHTIANAKSIISNPNNNLTLLSRSSSTSTLDWILQVGSLGGETHGVGISADNSGNIYATGYTDIGINGQKQNGIWDYFLVKYDKTGLLQWTKQVGDINCTTIGTGVSTDNSGNIYVSGYSTAQLTTSGMKCGYPEYFLAKYDIAGNQIWIKQADIFSSTMYWPYSYGYAVSADNFGNIYVAGMVNNPSSRTDNYFVARYDSNGNLLWSEISQDNNSGGYGVRADNLGHMYFDGFFYSYYNVARYDEAGLSDLSQWSRTNGTNNYNSYAYGIGSDFTGNIYITGYTNVGLNGHKQNGKQDYFIAKYDANSNLIWIRQAGATNGDTEGRGISTDSIGNSYITGFTNVGLNGQKQNGAYDYYMAKYDTDGNLIGYEQIGATVSGQKGDTRGYGISTDNVNDTYVIGQTSVGLHGNKQNGVYDYFIAKYIN